jgi:hemerythrin-like domain-containing protein
MKRSEALHSLSRDHHQALLIAQRLRRAEDPALASRRFLEFWKRGGELHFRIEEEVLLPRWALLGTVDGEAAARLAREHLSIRRAAMALERPSPSLEQLHDLGEELETHVRFEERELFRLLEADLDEDGLTQLAKAVSDAEEKLGASHHLGAVF